MAAWDELQVLKTALDYQLGLLGNGSLTEESFKATQSLAKEFFRDFVNAAHPWAAMSTEDAMKSEIQSLLDVYKETIGDPSDPQFMAQLTENLARIRAERVKPREESEEDRIERLRTERNLGRRR